MRPLLVILALLLPNIADATTTTPVTITLQSGSIDAASNDGMVFNFTGADPTGLTYSAHNGDQGFVIPAAHLFFQPGSPVDFTSSVGTQTNVLVGSTTFPSTDSSVSVTITGSGTMPAFQPGTLTMNNIPVSISGSLLACTIGTFCPTNFIVGAGVVTATFLGVNGQYQFESLHASITYPPNGSTPVQTPEPATILLVGAGLLVGLGWRLANKEALRTPSRTS